MSKATQAKDVAMLIARVLPDFVEFWALTDAMDADIDRFDLKNKAFKNKADRQIFYSFYDRRAEKARQLKEDTPLLASALSGKGQDKEISDLLRFIDRVGPTGTDAAKALPLKEDIKIWLQATALEYPAKPKSSTRGRLQKHKSPADRTLVNSWVESGLIQREFVEAKGYPRGAVRQAKDRERSRARSKM